MVSRLPADPLGEERAAADADMGEIEGLQRSKTCQGLDLDDGEADPVHMFWNHTSHHLDWWRE